MDQSDIGKLDIFDKAYRGEDVVYERRDGEKVEVGAKKKKYRLATIKNIAIKLKSKEEVTATGIQIISDGKGLDQSYGLTDVYPSKGTLYDIRMGPIDRTTKCKTCGNIFDKCPGHNGYIELPFYITRPDRLQEIVKLLNLFSQSQDEEGYLYPLYIIDKDAKLGSYRNRMKKIAEIGRKHYYPDHIKKSMLKDAKYSIVTDTIKKFKIYRVTRKVGDKTETLELEELRNILKRIRTSDLADYYGVEEENVSRPENSIVDVIEVPATRSRMPLQLGTIQHHEITKKLIDILKAVGKYYERRDDAKIYQYEVEHIYREMIFQSGASKANSKKIGLKSVIGDKGGVMHSFVAKVTDYGARSTISPDPLVKLSDIWVGTEIADKLTKNIRFYRFLATRRKIKKSDVRRIMEKYFVGIYDKYGKQELDKIYESISNIVVFSRSKIEKEIKKISFEKEKLIKENVIPDMDNLSFDVEGIERDTIQTMTTDTKIRIIQANSNTNAPLVFDKSKISELFDIEYTLVPTNKQFTISTKDLKRYAILRRRFDKETTLKKIKIETDVEEKRVYILNEEALDEMLVKDTHEIIAQYMFEEIEKLKTERSKGIMSFMELFEKRGGRKRIIKKVTSFRFPENKMNTLNLDTVDIKDIRLTVDDANKYYVVNITYIDQLGEKNIFKLGEGDKVNRRLVDGDYVVLVRSPVLHKQNFQSFRIKIKPNLLTIKINPSIAKGYAADFDGDEMNILLPQSIMSEAELRYVSNLNNALVSESNSKLITGIVQDTLTSIGSATRPGIKFTKDEIVNALCAANLDFEVEDLFRRAKEVGVQQNSGLVLFSSVLPPDFYYNKYHIEKGIVKKGPLNKSSVNNILQYLLNRIHTPNYLEYVIDANWRLQQIFNYIIGTKGFSVALRDITLSKKSMRKIETISLRAAEIAGRVRPSSMPEAEYELITTQEMDALRSDTTKIVMEDVHTSTIEPFKENELSSIYKIEVYSIQEFSDYTGTNKNDSLVYVNPLIRVVNGPDIISDDFRAKIIKPTYVSENYSQGENEFLSEIDDPNLVKPKINKNKFYTYALEKNNQFVYSSDIETTTELKIMKDTIFDSQSGLKFFSYNKEYKFAYLNSNKIELSDFNVIVVYSNLFPQGSVVFTMDNVKYMNPFHIMIQSGSKGTELNLAQSSGLIGQQNFHGGRIPNTQTTGSRVLNTFEPNSTDPRSRGFIMTSYREGYNLEDLILSFIAGRPNIIAGPISTANSGYFEKRLVRIMDNIYSDSMCGVRDRAGNVVQFLYGNNGLALDKIIDVDNHSTFADVKSLTSEIKNKITHNRAFIFEITSFAQLQFAKLFISNLEELIYGFFSESLYSLFDVVIYFDPQFNTSIRSLSGFEFRPITSSSFSTRKLRFIPKFVDVTFREYETIFNISNLKHLIYFSSTRTASQKQYFEDFISTPASYPGLYVGPPSMPPQLSSSFDKNLFFDLHIRSVFFKVTRSIPLESDRDILHKYIMS